jgi:hypothetical protein
MLMTILYTPRVESPAQPKYTPDVCSDSMSEKFSAGKFATRQTNIKLSVIRSVLLLKNQKRELEYIFNSNRTYFIQDMMNFSVSQESLFTV